MLCGDHTFNSKIKFITTIVKAVILSIKLFFFNFYDRVLSFVESGIIQHRAQQLLPEAVICPLDLASKERQLRNSDLWTTYIIVMSGFSTAFTVFVAELIWRRCLRPQHPRLASWPLDVSLHHPDSLALSRSANVLTLIALNYGTVNT